MLDSDKNIMFSIIVPVYNAGNYLTECLDSILSQSWIDYEAIIVDDGSTDGSENVCDRYAERDSRFKVVHKANGGLVSARKAALDSIAGDYVISVDSDDTLEPDYLQTIASEIKKTHPDMLAWNYKVVDDAGKMIRTVKNACKEGLYEGSALALQKKAFLYEKGQPGLNGGNLIYSIWTKAVKSDIYIRCQKQVDDKIRWGEDAVLVFLIMQEIKDLQVCGFDGYCFRSNPMSMTHKPKEDEIYRINTAVVFLNNAVTAEVEANQVYAYAANVLFLLLYKCMETDSHLYDKITDIANGLSICDLSAKAEVITVKVADRLKMRMIKNRSWKLLKLMLKMNILLHKLA